MVDFDSLPAILQSAAAALKDDGISELTRVALLEGTSRLTQALRTPKENLYILAQKSCQISSIRVFIELGLFKEIASNRIITSQSLAEKSGAEKKLIERFARVLVAAGFIEEVGEYTYGPNAITNNLATRRIEGMMITYIDYIGRSQAAVPQFLQERGWKEPESATDTPFGLAFDLNDKSKTSFDYMMDNPHAARVFHDFFEVDRGDRPCWVNWFPVENQLLDAKPLSSDKPLFIDVAGGRGHDLLEFIKKFDKKYKGRYILQDLPEVCADNTVPLDIVDHRVEKKPFDLFDESLRVTPGARIYYMKYVLHDWSWEKSLKILSNLALSMEKDYSTLVIEDFVLPDKGCKLLPAQFDIMMMAMTGSAERTELQWRKLLEVAGFKIEGIHHPPGDGTSIIVANLK